MKMKCEKCGTKYNGKQKGYTKGGMFPGYANYLVAVDADNEELKECSGCGVDIEPSTGGGCRELWKMTSSNLKVLKEVEIRDFQLGDLEQLIALYQEVFAGDIKLDNGGKYSWGEFMKCNNCKEKYTREEVSELMRELEESGLVACKCKGCSSYVSPFGEFKRKKSTIEKLVPYWSSEKVESIILNALEESRGKVKVALAYNRDLVDDEVVGFAMYFVNKDAPDIVVNKNASDIGYLADMGVDPSKRKKGIATALLQTLDEWAEENNLSSVYLRTDERNLAAVNLYEADGFEKTGATEQDDSVQDKEYRIYLKKEMAAPKERGDDK